MTCHKAGKANRRMKGRHMGQLQTVISYWPKGYASDPICQHTADGILDTAQAKRALVDARVEGYPMAKIFNLRHLGLPAKPQEPISDEYRRMMSQNDNS